MPARSQRHSLCVRQRQGSGPLTWRRGDPATDWPDGTVQQMVSTGWRRLRQEAGAVRPAGRLTPTGVARSHNGRCWPCLMLISRSGSAMSYYTIWLDRSWQLDNISCVRWLSLLDGEGDVLSSSGRSVVYFFFLLTQLLNNGWTDVHQIFTKRRLAVLLVNGGTAMTIGPTPPLKRGPKGPFFERNFRLRCLRTAAALKWAVIMGKLEQLV